LQQLVLQMAIRNAHLEQELAAAVSYTPLFGLSIIDDV
jgi:hypothetical protein